MRPSGEHLRTCPHSPTMYAPTSSIDPESDDDHAEVRRLTLALRLVKLTLGVVASALTIAKILGYL